MNALGRGALLAGRYRLEERLTESDGVSLWRGVDTTLDRQVAIRLIAPRTATETLDAARRAALLDDPRLVRLLDVARAQEGVPSDGSRTYVVSEWVEGRSLADLIAENGPLPADRVRMLVGEAAEALASAAARGLHHLSLDPTSILLTKDGSVRVQGLAVDAAAQGGAQPTGAAAERVDAVNLVALIYAGLTGRWPLPGQSHPGQPLDQAPIVGNSVVSPVEINSGVPGDLNSLCTVTLGAESDGPSSPAELARQLKPWGAPGSPGAVLTANRRLADDLRSAPRRPPGRFPVQLSPHEPGEQGEVTPGPSRAESQIFPTTAPTPVRTGRIRVVPRAEPSESPAPSDSSSGAGVAGAGTAAAGVAAGAGAAGVAAGRADSPSEADTGPTPTVQRPAESRPADGRSSAALTKPDRSSAQTGTTSTAGTASTAATVGAAGASGASGPSDVDHPVADTRPQEREPRTPQAASPAPSRRRWTWVPIVAVVALLGLGLWLAVEGLSGSSQDTANNAATASETASPSTSPAPVGVPPKIAAVTGFDPQGDGEENNSRAQNAVDGDPDTNWRSNRYNSAAFGNLKNGVGLLIKLEAPSAVSKVSVTVEGDGGAVEVRTASSEGLDGSQVVASGPAGTLEKDLQPPVNAQYVIVWFTELPRVDGVYRAVVDEVKVS